MCQKKKKLFYFFLKTFQYSRYRPQPCMRNPPKRFFEMLNRYLSIKIDVNWATLWDSLILLCFCMVHSVVNNSSLRSVELNKKLFLIFFSKLFLTGSSIPTLCSKLSTYFSRAQVFVKFIGVWGLLHQCGTTAQHIGTFLLNLGMRKMCSKLLTCSNLFKTPNFPYGKTLLESRNEYS